uniref:C-type lectin domain-containing protein n=1 Tax=Biomphalaria glabrata TaxID=6526 RepID=A0A2C9KZZ3_BIOGL
MRILIVLLPLTFNAVFSEMLDTEQLEGTTTFGNNLYLISKTFVDNYEAAQKFCSDYGAYVAEIDTEEEFRFLLEFQQSKNAIYDLFISGTDAATEDKWLHQRTGAEVKFFKWVDGQPSNTWGSENCLELISYYGGGMNDMKCVYPERPIRILCEKESIE